MSGNFSSEFTLDENEQTIPFYNSDYEEEILSAVGLGESVVPTPSMPSKMSGMPLPIEDPNYFLEFEDILAPDFYDYKLSPSPADVKPEELEPVVATRNRYEPYSVPSKEEPKRKRGRPMKSGSNSKMANYSRQYREMKKNQLAESELKADKLQQENEDLRTQLKELTAYMEKLEAEVQQLRSLHQPYSHSVPVMTVNQFY